MNYWVLKTDSSQDAAFLSAVPPNGPKAYKYDDGISLKDSFPAPREAEICFSSSMPDTIRLYDFVENIDGKFIVSEKVKTLLESLNIDNIEYLQVTLLNHQKETASNNYYIINVLGSIACVDMNKSDMVMSALIPNQVQIINKLVIDENKIPAKAQIFRLSVKTDEYIIHDDIRAIFEDNNITNYSVYTAQGWDGFDI